MTVRRPRPGRAGRAGALATAALLALTAAPAVASVDTWEDLDEPSVDELKGSVGGVEREQLAASVRVFDLSDSVRIWDVRDSVRGLVIEESDGAESVITLSTDLLFEFGSADLADGTAESISQSVAGLPEGAEVDVRGHTDSTGSDEINIPLSTDRAEAVAAVLREVRSDLVLTIEGFGSSRPVASETSGGEDDPAGRALNRRVEIRYGD